MKFSWIQEQLAEVFTLRKMEETDGPEGVVFGHVADAVLERFIIDDDIPRKERHHGSELI